MDTAAMRAALLSGKPIDTKTLQGWVDAATAEVQRLEGTRLPVGRTLDPSAQGRIAREMAAGQTAPPSTWDNLGAAFNGTIDSREHMGAKGGADLLTDVGRVGRDVASGLTFGYSDRLDPEGRAKETAAAASEKGMYFDNPHPTLSAMLDGVAQHGGRVGGELLSSAKGPLSYLAKGASGLLGMAETAVPELATTGAGRILGQGLVGGTVSGVDAAANTASRGGSLSDVAGAGLEGARGGYLFGSGLQSIPDAVAPLARKVGAPIARAVLSSAGALKRKLIEKYAGKVSSTTSGEGGIFNEAPDSPRGGLKGLEGDFGKGEAAARSSKRMMASTDEANRLERQIPYQMAMANADRPTSPHQVRGFPQGGQTPVHVDDILHSLEEATKHGALSVSQRGAIESQIADFKQRYKIPPPLPRARQATPPRPEPGLTNADPELSVDRLTPTVPLSEPGPVSPEYIPRERTQTSRAPGRGPEPTHVDAEYSQGPRALPGMEGHEPTISEGTAAEPEISVTGPRPDHTEPSLSDAPLRAPDLAMPPIDGAHQYSMTHQQLNQYRRMLDGMSGVGMGERSVPQAILSDTAALARRKVDTGPYRDINKRYHDGKVDESELRKMLRQSPDEGTPLSEENKLALMLERQGQDTVTAGRTTYELPEVKRRYPRLERDIDMPAVLDAKNALGFRVGSPTHGGLVNQIAHSGLGPSLAGAGIGAGIGLLQGDSEHHNRNMVMGAMAGLLHHNRSAIEGRLLYGPAQAMMPRPPLLGPAPPYMAGKLPQLMPASIPELMELYRQAMADVEEKDRQAPATVPHKKKATK